MELRIILIPVLYPMTLHYDPGMQSAMFFKKLFEYRGNLVRKLG